MARRPDTDTQAQAIIFAEVYGDEAACRRFKLSARSLRRYRELAREEGSELSETVRRYAEVLNPGQRAASFSDWLLSQVQDSSKLLLRKAEDVSAKNPEALRVINEHVTTLLDHKAALNYIDRLFAPAPEDAPSEDEEDEA